MENAAVASGTEFHGTEEEWNALSREQQDVQWETFHELNVLGTADNMYFYKVMMKEFLVGYVGH